MPRLKSTEPGNRFNSGAKYTTNLELSASRSKKNSNELQKKEIFVRGPGEVHMQQVEDILLSNCLHIKGMGNEYSKTT